MQLLMVKWCLYMFLENKKCSANCFDGQDGASKVERSKGKALATFALYNNIPKEYNNIPKELRDLPNWLVWKQEEREGTKTAKVPYSPVTGHRGNKADKCGTYGQAIMALTSKEYDGIGFQVSGTPYTVIDLDHCVENRALTTETAIELFTLFAPSYVEYSPSGTGIHIIVEGKTPHTVRNKGEDIEIYSDTQFITVTGDILQGADGVIHRREKELCSLYAVYRNPTTSLPDTNAETMQFVALDAEEKEEVFVQISKALEHDNTGKFRRLFIDGDLSDYGSGKSEGDLALMRMLAYWFEGDIDTMLYAFSLSPLGKRVKWTTREDYRRLTLLKAINHWKEHHIEYKKGDEDMAVNYFSVYIDEINRGNIRVLERKYGIGVIRWLNAFRSLLAMAYDATDNPRPCIRIDLDSDEDLEELGASIGYTDQQANGYSLREFITDLTKKGMFTIEEDCYYFADLEEYYQRRSKNSLAGKRSAEVRKRKKEGENISY